MYFQDDAPYKRGNLCPLTQQTPIRGFSKLDAATLSFPRCDLRNQYKVFNVGSVIPAEKLFESCLEIGDLGGEL